MKNLKINFNSIKSKLILVSVMLLLTPLAVLGIFSYQKSENSLNDLGATNLKNSVEMTIGMIEALNAEVEMGKLSLDEAQERVKILVLGEKQADGTRPINTNIDLGENGYIFILDDEGNQIAHPKLEGQNSWDSEDPNGIKSTQEIIKQAQNGGGLTYFDWPLPGNENQIKPKVSYSQKDSNWGWTVVAGTYMMDFNKPANDLLKVILIVEGIALLVGIIVVWLFANNISKPIKKVSEHMMVLSSGDLTQEELHIKTKDEIGQLGNATNQLQSSLKKVMENVSKSSETLTSHSEELTQSANEVKAGSEQVAVTMQELASGTETQANSASDLASSMSTFAIKVQEANENGSRVENSSKEVLTMTNEGSQLMKESTLQMNKIDQIVQDAVHKVQGLDKQSQQISNLVTVIKDVAEQTNLLALNAAIEAARAGEHGKGFAVVADEVRKLAEQVSVSVTDITDIVTNIQNESSVVAESLQNGYQEVKQGTSKIDSTGRTFNMISESVTEMANNITKITENLSDIEASTQEMHSSIEEIASISEESAAGVEQTSASSQQTSSIMIEVAESSEQLSKLAEELNELVRHFKL